MIPGLPATKGLKHLSVQTKCQALVQDMVWFDLMAAVLAKTFPDKGLSFFRTKNALDTPEEHAQYNTRAHGVRCNDMLGFLSKRPVQVSRLRFKCPMRAEVHSLM